MCIADHLLPINLKCYCVSPCQLKRLQRARSVQMCKGADVVALQAL